MTELREFKVIFDQYYNPIKNFIYYKVGEVAVAEDLAQEVFMKLWEKRTEVKKAMLKPYVYTIAKNLTINHHKHQQVVLEFSKKPQKAVDGQNPQYVLEEQEFGNQLKKAISTLPEDLRIVFLMNRIDELTYAEIAERLELTIKAIEKRMQKALIHLKETISIKI